MEVLVSSFLSLVSTSEVVAEPSIHTTLQYPIIKLSQKLQIPCHAGGVCYGVIFIAAMAFLEGKSEWTNYKQRLLSILRYPEDTESLGRTDVALDDRSFLISLNFMTNPKDFVKYFRMPFLISMTQDSATERWLSFIKETDREGRAISASITLDGLLKMLGTIEIDCRSSRFSISPAITGYYTPENLKQYFELLQRSAGHLKFTILFYVNFHSILVMNDPENKCWSLVDANQGIFSGCNITEILAHIMHGVTLIEAVDDIGNFSCGNRFICDASTIEQLYSIFHSTDWIDIHTVTASKVKADKDASWLHIASQLGDVHTVNALLAEGVDVNIPERYTATSALWIAAQGGHADIVRTLILAGANVNYEGRGVALYIASEHGHDEVVEILIAANANVNIQTVDLGYTALFQAASKGHYEVAKKLLNKGAEVNHQASIDGTTALMMAAYNGHFHLVQLLIAHKAILHLARTSDRRTALDLAILGGEANIINALVTKGIEEATFIALIEGRAFVIEIHKILASLMNIPKSSENYAKFAHYLWEHCYMLSQNPSTTATSSFVFSYAVTASSGSQDQSLLDESINYAIAAKETEKLLKLMASGADVALDDGIKSTMDETMFKRVLAFAKDRSGSSAFVVGTGIPISLADLERFEADSSSGDVTGPK